MNTANKQTLIHHFLEKSAQAYPDKIALIHEEVRATYSQINANANRLARWFSIHGVSIGDRIVILLENSLQYVESYYGVLKAGGIAVPLSTDLKPDGLKYLISKLEPKFIISSSKFERLLKAASLENVGLEAYILKGPKLKWSSEPCPVVLWEDVLEIEDSSNLDISIDNSDLASIIFTSGSTGAPKGVMLTHHNIVSNTLSICKGLHLSDKDIQMVVLPFFYVMGKSLLNTHVAVGGTVVINNKFAFPATVIKQMVEEQVTGFSGVPSTYAYLLHRSPLEQYRHQLQSLRYCSQAGGHMVRQVKEALRDVLPEHTDIYIMYGATEASARLTCLDPKMFKKKIGSIGKPISDITIKIIDGSGQEISDSGTGELVASGPNIMRGYWKDTEATSQILDNLGYHTGDHGYRDKDGYYYITGRKDDLLKVGGHRINLMEIEDAIMETELVLESVVIGVPDSLLGHKLIAFVSPKNENLTRNQLVGRCSLKLPKFKLPEEVVFISSLPKNTNGKIDKPSCLKLIANP